MKATKTNDVDVCKNMFQNTFYNAMLPKLSKVHKNLALK